MKFRPLELNTCLPPRVPNEYSSCYLLSSVFLAPGAISLAIKLRLNRSLLVICIFVAIDIIKALVRIGQKPMAK